MIRTNPKTRVVAWLASGLACVGLASVAFADVVVTKDGRRIEGRTTTEGDEVIVRRKFGEVRIPRADVVRIEKVDDVYSQLERKQHDLGNGTADERYRLGEWCRSNGLDAEAKAAFLSVLKLDPDHTGARAALGYVREDGRWITEDDQMRAKGLVQWQGRWVTPAEKVRGELDQIEKKALAKETARKAEEEKAEKRRAKLEAEHEARLARIRAYEEELARARARERAADEAEGYGFTSYQGYVGPYGVYGGYPYGCGWGTRYWVGRPTTRDEQLIYAGWAQGRYRGPNTPFLGRTVTVYGGNGCGPTWSRYRTVSGGAGGYSYGSTSSSSGWGVGVQLSGSWTSRSGRSSVRFRTGF